MWKQYASKSEPSGDCQCGSRNAFGRFASSGNQGHGHLAKSGQERRFGNALVLLLFETCIAGRSDSWIRGYERSSDSPWRTHAEAEPRAARDRLMASPRKVSRSFVCANVAVACPPNKTFVHLEESGNQMGSNFENAFSDHLRRPVKVYSCFLCRRRRHNRYDSPAKGRA